MHTQANSTVRSGCSGRAQAVLRNARPWLMSKQPLLTCRDLNGISKRKFKYDYSSSLSYVFAILKVPYQSNLSEKRIASRKDRMDVLN
jgi:hypothetical protein